MSGKSKLSKLMKIFGSIYFLLNCIIGVVMAVFAIHAMIKIQMSPGFVVFILPLIGIFSGYWMRTGKYGWWRVSIIAVSLLLTLAIAFTTVFIVPRMEQHKQNKFESSKKVKTLKPEIKDQKLWSGLQTPYWVMADINNSCQSLKVEEVIYESNR